MHDFAPLTELAVNSTQSGILGLDLNDSTQPVAFTVTTSSGRGIQVSLKTNVGEMVRAVTMPTNMFNSERDKLKGMNEHTATVKLAPGSTAKSLSQSVNEAVNVGSVISTEPDALRFAGETLSSHSLVLVTIKHSSDDTAVISVNCEKMVIGSMLLNELKSALRP